MKQKVVIRVSMRNQKKGHPKALKIAVSHPGVESASLVGAEKDEVQVIGENIDAVEITSLLRKNVGPSEIISVGPVEQKKAEDPHKNDAKSNQVFMMPNPIYHYDFQYPIYQVVPQYHQEPSCSIM